MDIYDDGMSDGREGGGGWVLSLERMSVESSCDAQERHRCIQFKFPVKLQLAIFRLTVSKLWRRLDLTRLIIVKGEYSDLSHLDSRLTTFCRENERNELLAPCLSLRDTCSAKDV